MSARVSLGTRMGKRVKKRGKRGKHPGRAAPRSAKGQCNQAFKQAKSHLKKGHWDWLQQPDNQSLLARWERFQLSEQDRDITLAGEASVARQHNFEGEDSPESSGDSL